MERSRMIRRAQNSNRRIVKMTFVLTKAISREPVTHRVSDCIFKSMSCTSLYKCEPNVNHRNRVQASIVDRRSELWLSLGVMVSIKRISSVLDHPLR